MLDTRKSVIKFYLSYVFLTLTILFCLQSAVHAEEWLEGDHLRIQWLAPESFANNAQSKTIGVYFQLDPEWHVYWRNPGDSGTAPRFSWQGENFHVGETQWPYPHRIPVAHLTNLGYSEEVAYLFQLDFEPAIGDQLNVTLDLEWLVCKEECIPGFGSLTLTRPVAGELDQWETGAENILREFKARIPQSSKHSPWRIHRVALSADNANITVNLQTSEKANVSMPQIYPLDGNFITAAAPKIVRTQEGFEARFNTMQGLDMPAETGFVVVDKQQAWEFPNIKIEMPVASETRSNTAQDTSFSLVVLLLLAFVGGVILNLMPCVFPVLSIKLFSLIKSSGQGASVDRVKEGLLYAAGVLATFFILGAIFLGLRAGGLAIGWGFQLQNPFIVLGLALLFWMMALSFVGAFEFGHALVNLAGKSGSSSSFATGVLAVFVAAPCTGPFMGAALGASAILPPLEAMTIFLGLGAGLAAPFLLLAISPRLSSFLPKPGPWMESLRQFLAFPLFATVLWLLWVLNYLVDGQVWLLGASLLLGITFAIWLGRSHKFALRLSAWIIGLLALFVVIGELNSAMKIATNSVSDSHSEWQAYDAEKISTARANGTAVFIDFTAAWCITCQVNKKLVLDTDSASTLFKQNNVLRIRADWTRYDARITQALAAVGRNSVPVYIFYPAGGGDPQLLPQILTLDILQELF